MNFDWDKIRTDTVSRVLAAIIIIIGGYIFAELASDDEGANRLIYYILIGMFLVLLIVMFFYKPTKKQETSLITETDVEYDVDILFPKAFSREPSPIRAYGSYKALPKDHVHLILTYNNAANEYYVKNNLILDSPTMWHSDVHIGGNFGQERTINVVSASHKAMYVINKARISGASIPGDNILRDEIIWHKHVVVTIIE